MRFEKLRELASMLQFSLPLVAETKAVTLQHLALLEQIYAQLTFLPFPGTVQWYQSSEPINQILI
jgi:hypothetical protein